MACVCVAVLAVSARSANESSDVHAEGRALRLEVNRLSGTVLDDPLDSVSMDRLVVLRGQQKAFRRAGLAGLAEGLEGCLAGDRLGVVEALEQAQRSTDVVALADAVLAEASLTLEALIEDCRQSDKTGLCATCGQTGQADCPHCDSTGVRACRDCRGVGQRLVIQNRSRRVACDRCNARGTVACAECDGHGVTACATCRARSSDDDRHLHLDAAEQTAVRKLIAIARDLLDGGVDLYSPQALAKSPRLKR
jgi:hypothetical protein